MKRAGWTRVLLYLHSPKPSGELYEHLLADLVCFPFFFFSFNTSCASPVGPPSCHIYSIGSPYSIIGQVVGIVLLCLLHSYGYCLIELSSSSLAIYLKGLCRVHAMQANLGVVSPH